MTTKSLGQAIRQRLEEISAQDEVRWCVHTYGPDDIHASADRESALEEANALNAIYTSTTWDEHTPLCIAVVERWPYSKESHDAALKAAREVVHG